MAIDPLPPLYKQLPPTQENLEFADLVVIDLSKADTIDGRKELLAQLTEVLKIHGCFYVINHGYTLEQTNQIFSIANITFDEVSPEEKVEYTSESLAIHQGYREPREITKGVQDRTEQYTIHRHLYKQSHPPAIRPFLPLIDHFARHNHFNVLYPILRLIALSLELPEDTLVNKHRYEEPGHSSVKFKKYYPRSADVEEMTKNVWLKGHTDFGGLTICWSQPIGGLQILLPGGKWQWIRHIENALIINIADTLEYLSGGFYPATIHRVVQPPADQCDVDRVGVFYFASAEDDTVMRALEESPVLKRVGIRTTQLQEAPTQMQWRMGRSASYGKVELKPGKENGVEEEIVEGAVVKHYN